MSMFAATFKCPFIKGLSTFVGFKGVNVDIGQEAPTNTGFEDVLLTCDEVATLCNS